MPIYNIDEEEKRKENPGKEESPLYSLEEDEISVATDAERHGGNLSDYSEEDLPMAYGHVGDDDETEEEEAEASPAKKKKPAHSAAMLFKIMFSPVTGWKDLKRRKLSPERVGAQLFYPVCAITALSEFLPMLHEANHTWTELFVAAVITFVSFFFSNLIIPPMASLIMGGEGAKNMETPYAKSAVMVLLSTLAIFQIIYNLLPSLEPVVVFLPIWTLYLVSRFVPTLKGMKEQPLRGIIMLSLLILGLPALWRRLLDLIMPSV